MALLATLKQCSGAVTNSCVNVSGCWRNFMNATTPLLFRASSPLQGEPLKKKKKVDANILVQRELKKKRKIEKQIKKLELKGLTLKPVEEIEGHRNFLKTLDQRKRATIPLTFDESEERALLHKKWSHYKQEQFIELMNAVMKVQNAQRKALHELRQESEQLYEQAIQIDENFVPFERKGPVETPPIKGYIASDGEHIDTTRKFDK